MQEEKTEIERCDFIHVHEDVVKKVKEHIPACLLYTSDAADE